MTRSDGMEKITDDVLAQFKARNRISHDSEDNSLKAMLGQSYDAISTTYGDFDITENARGCELVFERTRYALNDSLEYFNDNFREDLMNLSFEIAGESDE